MRRLTRGAGTLLTCLALGATVGATGAAARVRPHSSGPVVTSPTTAPWAVRLDVTSSEGDFTCTGSIIDATHVLTAGHCAFNEDDGDAPFAASDFKVTAGEVNVDDTATAQTVGVSAVRVDPGFTPGSPYNPTDDVSELTLSTALHFDAEVGPVAIGTAAQTPATGAATNVFSWGTVDGAGDYDGNEHELPATVQLPWSCGDDLPNIICTQSTAGDNCPGDSGSGVIVDEPTPTLVAVLDFGPADAPCTSDDLNGMTTVTNPHVAAFLAGAAPPAAPSVSGGPTLDPGSEQVGSTMTCAAPAFANASSVGYEFVTGAGAILQSGPATFVVPAAALGQTIYCVAVGSGPGGSNDSAGNPSDAIAPQSTPGLRLTISRRGTVSAANASSSGLVMVLTATRRGASTPALTRTLTAARRSSVKLGRLLPGVYRVCVSTVSEGVYAAGRVCRTWRHGGSALRFISHRSVRVHHHAAVLLRATGPLRGVRVHVAWTRGRHVIRRLTVRLRATVILRAPRGARDLRLSVGRRRGDGVKLTAGTARVRLRS